MKRNDLIKLLKKNGWKFEREGGNHTIYVKGDQTEAIERHSEIPEPLARKIIKRRGLE